MTDCRKKIVQLNSEIAELKANMSPEAGSTTVLTATGEVLQLTSPFDSLHLTTPPATDDVAVDPAVMQAKIKELTARISEVSLLVQIEISL